MASSDTIYVLINGYLRAIYNTPPKVTVDLIFKFYKLDTIIIDPGSEYCKVGFAGDEIHKEIPSATATQKEATEEHTKASERNKVLSDAMKQSDLYFMHSQILNKVGRFSDCVMYCKKAISTL
eukprot:189135_1